MNNRFDETYVKVKDIDLIEVPDGYVVYYGDTARVIFLNRVAAAVLELCDGNNDLARIADVIKEAFKLSAAPDDDINSCVQSLCSEGLVRPCSRKQRRISFSLLGRLVRNLRTMFLKERTD